MPSTQRDVLFAGIYDPMQRRSPEVWQAALGRALQPFGAPAHFERRPLHVAVSGVATAPRDPAFGRSLVVLDGYLTAPPDVALSDAAESWIATRFAQVGTALLDELEGAFSILCWDDERRRGVVARDHFGQHGLFFAEQEGVLFFSTEIRPLLEVLPRRPAPNEEAIARYLAPSGSWDDLLLYSGIERVPNASALELADGEWRLRPYWVPRFEGPHEGTFEELAAETRSHLAAAVDRHSRDADLAGVLLSGGIDSTTVAALAAPALRSRGAELRAYSGVFPSVQPVDESELISTVAADLRIPSTRLAVLGGSSIGGLIETLERWHVPELTANGFWMRTLSEHAVADGIDVMLGGEGGDEIFAAPEFAIADRVAAGRLFGAARLVRRFPNISYHGGRRLRLRLLRDFGLYPNLPLSVERSLTRRSAREDVPSHIAPHWRQTLLDSVEPRPWRHIDGPHWWASRVDRLLRRASTIGGFEMILRSARLRGMTHRNPMMDRRLIEWSLRVPPDHVFDPDRTRPVLRAAMRGLLPDSVVLRPDKVAFDAVRGLSLQDDRAIVRELVGDRGARIRAYTVDREVDALVEEQPGTWPELAEWSGHLLRVVALELWLRAQEDPSFLSDFRERHTFTPDRFSLER